MIRLLQIELNKLRSYRAFWVLIILYFAGLAGTLLSIQGIFNSFLEENVPSQMAAGARWDFYSLPDGWHWQSWIASWFNLLLPIVVVIIVSAEFSYKTVRQNVITGMSREEWMSGKLILMGFLALMSTLVVVVITLLLGLIHTDLSSGIAMFSKVSFILGYLLQTSGYLLLAMLLSIIIRNTGVTIGILTLYSLILEPVLCASLPDGFENFFPLHAMGEMLPLPFDLLGTGTGVLPILPTIISIIYIGLISGAGYLILKRRDL